ncbi:MAG: PGPGW domain-containing protein [Polyangiales bacterium]
MDLINADLENEDTPWRLFIVTLKCIAGGTLLLTGVIMIPLPGPGLPLIAAGIAILATEFDWAEQLQARAVAIWQRLRHKPPVVDFTVEQR